MSVLLEVRNLSRAFGERAVVQDLSLDIHHGEIFGLLGPNGAGKSTTMSMITGLLSADSGSVSIDGISVTPDAIAVRKRLGFVPQDLAIYPDLSASENLAFFGRLYRIPADQLRDRISEALELTGLSDRSNDEAGTFSGGMKRRLNFAAAILHRPALLILDEPTVGVDPQSRSHLLDCVRHLQSAGTAVIYASHYMEEVQAICSRVAIIDHGKLLVCGTMNELLAAIPGEVCVRISGHPLADLESKDGVAIRTEGETTVYSILMGSELAGEDVNRSVTRLLNAANDQAADVLSIRTLEPNLERLFLNLTGTSLRD